MKKLVMTVLICLLVLGCAFAAGRKEQPTTPDTPVATPVATSSVFCIMYNAGNVSAAPKSWADLAKAEAYGEVILVNPDTSAAVAQKLVLIKNAVGAEAYDKMMAKALIVADEASAVAAVAAGEYTYTIVSESAFKAEGNVKAVYL